MRFKIYRLRWCSNIKMTNKYMSDNQRTKQYWFLRKLSLILPPLFSSIQRTEQVDRMNKKVLIFLPFSISLNVIRLFSVPFRFFPPFFSCFPFSLETRILHAKKSLFTVSQFQDLEQKAPEWFGNSSSASSSRKTE